VDQQQGTDAVDHGPVGQLVDATKRPWTREQKIAHLALNGLALYAFLDARELRIKLNLRHGERAIDVEGGWCIMEMCAKPQEYQLVPWDELPPIPGWITRDELQKLIDSLTR
jgi:hypothetical protein